VIFGRNAQAIVERLEISDVFNFRVSRKESVKNFSFSPTLVEIQSMHFRKSMQLTK
jgi:hypothetical protein